MARLELLVARLLGPVRRRWWRLLGLLGDQLAGDAPALGAFEFCLQALLLTRGELCPRKGLG